MTPRDELKALLAQKELFIFDLDGTLFNTLGDLAPAVNYAMKQFGLKTHSNDDVRTFIGNGSMNLIRRAVAANYIDINIVRNFDKVAAVLNSEGYSEERIKEIHKVYSEYYWEHCIENTEPYEGVVELIKRIAQSAGCDRDSAGSFNRNEDCAENDKNSAINNGNRTGSNGYCAGAKCAAMLTNKPVAPAQKILEKFGLEKSFATYLCGDTTPERKPSPAGIFEILRQTGIALEKAIMIGDDTPDVLAAKNAGIDCITLFEGFGKAENLLPLSPRYTTGHIKDFAKFID
jgi:phosphoglycolate phosphatase